MSVCLVQVISRLDTQSKFQMLTLFFGQHVDVSMEVHLHGGSIQGSVNLCKIFRQISEV